MCHSQKPRHSPFATVLIEKHDGEGHRDLVTAYAGSSLKGGRAFAQAIVAAQADPASSRVIYMELVHAHPTVHVSVPVHHQAEAQPLAEEDFC